MSDPAEFDTGTANLALLYFDGDCAVCRHTAAWISRLDWLHRLRITSFRDDISYVLYGVSEAALERDMHLVNGARVSSGFEAVVETAKQLPLLWPILPPLWLVSALGLGQPAYRWLADNRMTLSSSPDCSEGCHRT